MWSLHPIEHIFTEPTSDVIIYYNQVNNVQQCSKPEMQSSYTVWLKGDLDENAIPSTWIIRIPKGKLGSITSS